MRYEREDGSWAELPVDLETPGTLRLDDGLVSGDDKALAILDRVIRPRKDPRYDGSTRGDIFPRSLRIVEAIVVLKDHGYALKEIPE